jgi:nucleotide-binding universal stress UspA family protein
MSTIEGIVTVDVRPYIEKDLAVYDSESTRVGTIEDFDLHAGYMKIRSNPLAPSLLYIPIVLISHIDRREAFLSRRREELQRAFRNPPPRSTVVAVSRDPDTGEDTSRAITSEPNGYDGTPVVVVEANIGEMSHHIAAGFRVHSSEIEDIGTVKEYYRDDKRMLVEHRLPPREDSIIPLELVASVDRDQRDIVLAVSAADLRRQENPIEGEPELKDVIIAAADDTNAQAEAESRRGYEEIVVALDGSVHAEQVLRYVKPLAQKFHSRVTCVFALVPGSAIDVGETSVPAGYAPPGPLADAQEEDRVRDAGYLEEIRDRLAREGFVIQYEEPEGDAAQAIVAAARNHRADLIAMSTHGRSGLRHALLGSVATEVVRTAPCPVMLVRVSDFV